MKDILSTPGAPRAFFNRRVFRDMAITLGLSFVGGFGLGFLRSLFGISWDAYEILIGASNLLSCLLGGFISGLSVPRHARFRHLQAVGLLVWLFGLINIALGVTDFAGFILSVLVIAACLALGGWSAGFFDKRQS
jgi:hypothetical protein